VTDTEVTVRGSDFCCQERERVLEEGRSIQPSGVKGILYNYARGGAKDSIVLNILRKPLAGCSEEHSGLVVGRPGGGGG